MKWTKSILIIVLAVILILIDLLPSQNEGKLKVVFIETGKSDSIFIKMPDGKTALIDGGVNESFPDIHDVLFKNDVKSIDYMINTHQHDDHLGAFPEILKIYDVKNFYMPKTDIENEYFKETVKSLKEKDIPINYIKRGSVIYEGDVKLEVLTPYFDFVPEEENNYSAVLMLTYKEKRFLFTADAQKIVLNTLVVDYDLPKCDVVKVSHHGSKDANSYYFFESVKPDFAVVTSKEREEYIEELLSEYEIKSYWTCDSGDITMVCDGENIEIKEERERNDED